MSNRRVSLRLDGIYGLGFFLASGAEQKSISRSDRRQQIPANCQQVGWLTNSEVCVSEPEPIMA